MNLQVPGSKDPGLKFRVHPYPKALRSHIMSCFGPEKPYYMNLQVNRGLFRPAQRLRRFLAGASEQLWGPLGIRLFKDSLNPKP